MAKVVWYEGMTLEPQHFQQWDRYHERRLDTRIRGLSRLGWGLTDLEVDADRLANGTFVVRTCSGVLPDGLVFDLPADGPLPAPRPVDEHLAATATQADVYLAIPADHPSRSLIQRPVRAATPSAVPAPSGAPRGDGGAAVHTRYTAQPAGFRDDTTGADEQSIEVAQTNVQVRFEGESMDGYAAIPIARIVRENGSFALDPSFVPCVLYVDASPRLQAIGRRVLELLVTKSRALTERQRAAATQREFAPADALRLGLLGAVNTSIPALCHVLDGGPDHPAALFDTLATLAGRLSPFAPSLPAPQDLPTYDHRAPGAPFNTLFDQICGALQDTHAADTYHQIPLAEQRDNLFVATLTSPQIDRAQLLLAARSEARTEDQLVDVLPHMLRIASPGYIDQILGHSVSALRIEPTRRLPPGMPIDERASYFRLLKDGPFWDAIAADGELAIFRPSEYADVTLSLTAAD